MTLISNLLIFRSKNTCLVLLTAVLNCFQFLICLKDLYLSRSLMLQTQVLRVGQVDEPCIRLT